MSTEGTDKKYLLGIDNGSTAIKAALFDLAGNEICVCGSVLDTDMPKPGYYERDTESIWQANIKAIESVIDRSGVNPEDILAVSLTGYGECLTLTDENGKPVYPTVIGTDTRAAELLEEWRQNGIADRLQELTYLIPYTASSGLLFAWMKKNAPDVMEKARWFFTAKDYIRFKLTGNPAGESTNNDNTGFTNLLEPGNDSALFELQGIQEYQRLIPPAVGSSEVAGYITGEAASLTKLAEGTPVVAGCYDICAAGLACGLTDESRAVIIVGTWGNNTIISKEPLVSKDILVTCNYPKKGYWMMCDGSPTSACTLEWFVQEFMQEERKTALAEGTNVYDICNSSVGETRPDETEIIFLPLLYGGYGTGYSKAAFLNIEGWHTRKHIIRAIYEGICFSHKRHFSSVMRFSRSKPASARICGGGSRSDEWMQIFADAFGMPMEIVNSSEPGALGSCICAAVGVGLYADFDEAVKNMVRIKKTVLPNPAMKDIYEKKYAIFNRAIDMLGDLRIDRFDAKE